MGVLITERTVTNGTFTPKVNYKKLVYLSGQQYLWYFATVVRCAAYMLNGIKQSLLKIDQ
ncbi:hypothetical protein DF182_21175 [Chitinophaga flava]|uniref:Uncharacterized protein n=1 Tax=Chitinophaga flava TaxID=2259036 RepID=A0A365XRU7_9BACT|nr:hypothetical protein DF182_21175 [Chitinophaga flava]